MPITVVEPLVSPLCLPVVLPGVLVTSQDPEDSLQLFRVKPLNCLDPERYMCVRVCTHVHADPRAHARPCPQKNPPLLFPPCLPQPRAGPKSVVGGRVPHG